LEEGDKHCLRQHATISPEPVLQVRPVTFVHRFGQANLGGVAARVHNFRARDAANEALATVAASSFLS